MIVPSTRLILATGGVVVVTSIGTLAGTWGWAVPGVVGLGFLVAAVADAVLVQGRLDGMTAALPALTRMTKDKSGEIEIRLTQGRRRVQRLTLALALPPPIPSEHTSLKVALPEEGVEHRIDWPCTPQERGSYRLQHVHLAVESPLGLWSHYASLPAEGEIRVYPNMLRERKNLAALFLNRGLHGVHAQRLVGKGREFDQLREYIPGDSYEDIHWKATARRGQPVTKIYQVERTQEVYVIVDSSRLSSREVQDADGDKKTTQLERFVNAAMVLALVAERQGDRFGLLTFDDRVRTFLRARNGRAHFDACKEAVYRVEPRAVNPDFEELCAFIRLRLPKRALLIILTSLDDPVLSESFQRNVDLIARHHLVFVNVLAPEGIQPVFSDSAVVKLDDLYGRLGGHIEWHDLLELKHKLHFRGVTMTLLDHGTMTAALVSQYMNQKQRQLL